MPVNYAHSELWPRFPKTNYGQATALTTDEINAHMAAWVQSGWRLHSRQVIDTTWNSIVLPVYLFVWESGQ